MTPNMFTDSLCGMVIAEHKGESPEDVHESDGLGSRPQGGLDGSDRGTRCRCGR